MSVEAPREPVGGDRYSRGSAGYDDDRGGGWLVFAGVMLMIVGTLNFVYGIAAVDNANFYIGSAEFVISNLDTWGWVVMITGALQVLAAFGILAKNQAARWAGVFFASLNMLAQFLLFPAQPLWSLAVIAIDTLIIYGLVAYGGRQPAV
jgi:hypothetical protein